MPNLLSQKPLADFMREREDYCFKGQSIHQAAMLLSVYDQYREGEKLLARGDIKGKVGLTALLCDAGQSLEIISEHTLESNGKECAMIAVPETLEGLGDETVRGLLDYAENGSNLLLTGSNTCRIFAEAGAPFEVCPIEDELHKFKFLCQVNDTNDQRFWTIDGKSIGAVLYPVEIVAKGEHEVVAHTCYTVKSPWHPSVCGTLEIVCLEKDGQLMLQLINGKGDHSNRSVDTEAFIPPILDLELSIKCQSRPEKLLISIPHPIWLFGNTAEMPLSVT